MTKEEAIIIKGEILEKEGSIRIATLTLDGFVRLEDVLQIINKHIGKEKE